LKVLILLLTFTSLHAFASQGFSDEITLSLGMANVSYAEKESSLEGENKSEAASGSVSSLSGNFHWKFKSQEKKSYYVSATFPFMGGDGSSYFSVGGGIEFYLTPLGSRVGMQNQGTTVKFSPKLTYYWGVEAGLGYLVYLTETAKKTDMLFDIGLGGGGHYAINDSWVLKGQLGMTMGTGVNTSATAMKIFVGLTFYLDDLGK
jgi:hypothetical protein